MVRIEKGESRMVVAVVSEEWVHRRTDPVTEQTLPITYVHLVLKVRIEACPRYI